MDTQAINSTGNPIAPNPKPISSRSSHATKSSSVSSGDTVNLSEEAQSLVRRERAPANTTNYADGDQKKISVSDNNDVVLEIIDPQTQEVVRSVPSEEQLELRKAIRIELDKF